MPNLELINILTPDAKALSQKNITVNECIDYNPKGLRRFSSTKFSFLYDFVMDSIEQSELYELQDVEEKVRQYIQSTDKQASYTELFKVKYKFSPFLIKLDVSLERNHKNFLLWKYWKNFLLFIIDDAKCVSIFLEYHDIFYVKSGEKPPIEYNPEFDEITNDETYFLKATSSIQYLINKSLHNYIQSTRSALKCSYQTFNDKNKFLEFPFEQMEACHHLFTLQHRNMSYDDYQIVCLSPYALISMDTDNLLEITKSTRELFIVIKDEGCEDINKREQIRRALIESIEKKRFTAPIHLVFQTKFDSKKTLSLLNCRMKDESSSGYCKIAEDHGYYCCDQGLLINKQLFLAKANSNSSQQNTPTPQIDIKEDGYTIEENDYHENYRKTKQKEGRIQKAGLAVVHQLDTTHQQELSNTEQMNHETQVVVNQQINQNHQVQRYNSYSNYTFGLPSGDNYEQFCNYVKNQSVNIKKQLDNIFQSNRSLTQFYKNKISSIVEKLISDEEYRRVLVAGIFGHVIYQQSNIFYSHRLSSLDVILHDSTDNILRSMLMYIDGVDFSSKYALIEKVMPFLVNQLKLSFLNDYTYFGSVYTRRTWFDLRESLEYKRINSTVSDVLPVEKELLLFASNISLLTADEQQEWDNKLKLLVEIMQSNKPLESVSFETACKTIKSLVAQYVSDNNNQHEEYVDVLHKLLSYFPSNNSDNLRVLLYIFMTHRHPGLDNFFQLLIKLEKEQRLHQFYLLYFEYVKDFTDLANELSHSKHLNMKYVLFLMDYQKNKSFVDFFGSFYLFFNQNSVTSFTLTRFAAEAYWKRLYELLLVGCHGDTSQATALREKLIKNLISEKNGLNIETISNSNLFLAGLLNLIQNAINHGTLIEQVDCLDGLSFKWLDMNYAIEKNGFKVLSKEMQLDFSKQKYQTELNTSYPSYKVSSQFLLECIKNYPDNKVNLKSMLFRYLGGEGLKASLTVYRDLWDMILLKDYEAIALHSKEKIISYVALKTTRSNYGKLIDDEQLINEIIALHPQDVSMSSYVKTVIKQCKQLLENSSISMTTLWSSCNFVKCYQEDEKTIPSFLTEKFDAKTYMSFVLSQQVNLKKYASFFDQYKNEIQPYFFKACVANIFNQRGIKHEKLPFIFLNLFYKNEPFVAIFNDLPYIERFSHAYAKIINGFIGVPFDNALRHILKKNSTLNSMATICDLLEFLAETIGEESSEKKITITAQFINEIANHPNLLPHIKEQNAFLTALLKKYYENDMTCQWPLSDALTLAEKIILHYREKGLNKRWLLLLKQPKLIQLFSRYPTLTSNQLIAIGALVSTHEISIDLIEHCLSINHEYSFEQLLLLVEPIPEDRLALIFKLWRLCPNKTSINDYILLDMDDLAVIERLLENKQMTEAELDTLIQQKPLKAALAKFEQVIYAENLNRFDIPDGAHKAAFSINCLTPNSHCAFQNHLWDGYRHIMEYAKSLHGLSQEELQHKLAKATKNNKPIKILAIACEAMFRMTKKFPRHTQIYPVLLSLYEKENLIHEIKTGEGKSIITALQAVLFDAGGKQVHIATENTTLAQEHIHQFGAFYNYLGVSYSKTVLDSNGLAPLEQHRGIYCSTVGDMVLWKMKLKFENRPVPRNVGFICDEIDANLMRTLEYIFAASIDPIYKNLSFWKRAYELMNQFITEKKIFMDNHCASHKDVENFRLYFQLNNKDSNWNELIKTIPTECLDNLIEAALIAVDLEDDINSISVDDPRHEDHPYAAPIMDHRPAPRVSYSNNVQQLFHTRL